MPRFKFTYKTEELRLKQVFTISRGSKPSVDNVFVQLQSGGSTGYGEAAPNTRYNEDAGRVEAYINAIPGDFFDEIADPKEVAQRLEKLTKSIPLKPVKSAQSAVEMAYLDWWGKKQGQPLWKLWEAPSNTGPVTSYTIGLDTFEVMQRKVEQAAEYPVLKVKLGTDHDRQVIEAIREVTDKPLRVDANEGWKTLQEAKTAIDFLVDQNVEMVEQPMPASQVEDLIKLGDYSSIPLCADESFEGDEDLQQIARAFAIINIKLAKIGSLVKAKKVIEEAHELGLQVMIGCMIESSLADTASALLSLWADYADLDGHLLIADDPFEGLQLDEHKHITLTTKPGLGVKSVEDDK